MATITFTRGEPFEKDVEGLVKEVQKVTPVVDGVTKKDLVFEKVSTDEVIAEHLEWRHKRGLLF